MKIELKSLKIVEALSRETTCFTASVYVDGVSYGKISNHGHGGATLMEPGLFAILEKEAKNLPPVEFLDSTRPQTAEDVLENAITDAIVEKSFKSDIRKRLVGIKDGRVVLSKRLDPAAYKDHPERLAEFSDTILNFMPYDEALALYKKHVTG